MSTDPSSRESDFHVPDGVSREEALARCSHLGVGAHQDDLEFMAFHGIASCYGQPAHWFGGVTCTDGGGSARCGKYADYSDGAMRALRAGEQRQAADIGGYSFVAQAGFPSSRIKDPAGRGELVDELERILLCSQPEIVYTHNPADKHASHVAVVLATIEAVRRIPPFSRPKTLYGCEVWRDLDWLPDEEKIALDVSAHPELAKRLNACFESQIAGGKNYGEAVTGRRRANATFHDSHQVDAVEQLWFAMDLSPLALDDSLDPAAFVDEKIQRFAADVRTALSNR